MAANSLEKKRLRDLLDSPESLEPLAFEVASSLARLAGAGPDSDVQDLLLRAMDRKQELASVAEILNRLLHDLGLYPYVDTSLSGVQELLAYEFHRPEGAGIQDFVFHDRQARVYWLLMSGKSVVLSAPTSFGKSLIIDAVIASNRHRNIVVVVPTIALIDETRRRLAKFSPRYRILTHPSQKSGPQNVFVFTQERVLEAHELPRIDFFVIDEFYKLNPNSVTDERAQLLNHAFYRLQKDGGQFYMLGPGIHGIAEALRSRDNVVFLEEAYHTVATDVRKLESGGDPIEAVGDLCRSISGPTIIFCSSPGRAAKVATHLKAILPPVVDEDVAQAIDWMTATYHPAWHVPQSLRAGVCVHHARIPRPLAHYGLRLFNNEQCQFLVCTSTLIEGVNTKAKSIVVLDAKINRERLDLFTFNNIRGRSGRMFQHFVGHVYVFEDPPTGELPFVDIPAVSQSDATSTGLLLQMDPRDLTAHSLGRISRFQSQRLLHIETLQANIGVDPDTQLRIAEEIASNATRLQPLLSWSGRPGWDELQVVSDLIWRHFDGIRIGSGSARSSRQLAFLVNQLSQRTPLRALADSEIAEGADPNEAVQRILDFRRLWAAHSFPKFLRAVDRIQRDVFYAKRLPAGSYEAYARQVESLFSSPALSHLEEYGVPFELGRKLEGRLSGEDGLDGALARLRAINPDAEDLHPFERTLLRHAQEGLPVQEGAQA